MADSPFVGDGRHALVEGLLALYDEVTSTRIPAWVALEATTGNGKTRVVQEFYRRLALSRQGSPHYWPDSLQDPTNDTQPLNNMGRIDRSRKAIFPLNFTRPDGALLDWFWWGISCSGRLRSPVASLSRDLDQVALHADLIEHAARKRSLAHRARKSASRHSRDAAGAGVDELATATVGSLVPAFPLVKFLATRAASAVRDRIELRARLTEAEQIDAAALARQAERLADDTASMLASCAGTGFPIIIAVEDFHLADSLLIDLLTRLVNEEEAAIMIISTSWPGHTPDDVWARVPVERRSVFSTASLRRSHQVFDQRASLAPLGSDDLASLLAAEAHVEQATAEMLVRRLPNPLALRVFAGLGSTRSRLADTGVLVLSQQEIEALPTQVEDLYRASWQELPELVQSQLSLGAVLAPDRIAGPFGAGDDRWNEAVIDAVCDNDEFGMGDTAAHRPSLFGWSVEVDQALRRFSEPAQRNIALAYAEGSFVVDGKLLAEAATAVRTQLSTDPGPAQFEHLAKSWVGLVESGIVPVDQPGLRALSGLLRLTVMTVGDSEFTELLADTGLRWVSNEPAIDQEIEFLETRARCRIRRGASIEAMVDLDRLATITDPSSPIGLRLVFLNGQAQIDRGQYQAALQQFELLQIKQANVLGDDHRDTVRTKMAVAQCRTQLYDLQGAIGELHELVHQVERSGDIDSLDVLLAKKELGANLRRLGRLPDALSILESSRDDFVSLAGTSHPDSLAITQTLGAVLRDMGKLRRAETLFETLRTQRERILGPRHKATLTAASHLVWLRRHQGRYEDAYSLGRDWRAQLEASLGPDHLETIAADHVLGVILRLQGDAAGATAMLVPVIESRIELLGQDAYATLLSRRQLAKARACLGETSAAVRELESVLSAQRQLLGSSGIDSPSTEVDLAIARLMDGVAPNHVESELAAITARFAVLVNPHHPELARARLAWCRVLAEFDPGNASEEAARAATDVASWCDDNHPVLLALLELVENPQANRGFVC